MRYYVDSLNKKDTYSRLINSVLVPDKILNGHFGYAISEAEFMYMLWFFNIPQSKSGNYNRRSVYIVDKMFLLPNVFNER